MMTRMSKNMKRTNRSEKNYQILVRERKIRNQLRILKKATLDLRSNVTNEAYDFVQYILSD